MIGTGLMCLFNGHNWLETPSRGLITCKRCGQLIRVETNERYAGGEP